MELLPLYLKKTPCTDPYCEGRWDVLGFKHPDDKGPCAKWPWHLSSKPTRRNKYVVFNCYKWRIVWMEGTK